MTENIFEVVIGRGVLKWDAVWRVIEWLANPTEGHRLGANFQNQLSSFCFGPGIAPVEIRVEYYLGRDQGGRTKHPDIAIGHPDLEQPSLIALVEDLAAISPNNTRKITNLMTYAEICASRFPHATRCIVVVTDTTDLSRFDKLTQSFAGGSLATLTLLPLQTIATWIPGDPTRTSVHARAFSEWARSL